MERKRAWIGAGAVAVTFATAALAVMANTGLLSVAQNDRKVGRLTPTEVNLALVPAESSTTVKPVVVVRYEDVYVTAPPVPGRPTPTAATVPERTGTGSGTTKASAKTPAKSTVGTHEGSESEGGEHEDHEYPGESDDD